MVPFDRPLARGELSRPVLVLLALGHCAAFTDRNLLAVAAPLLKADLGLSDVQLGVLMGPAFAALYAVGMLASVPLSGARHRFRLLAGCVALWMAGMTVFALADTFGALFVARVLVGLGQSAYIPLALGLIVDDARPRERGRSMAVFTAGSVIGRSLALLLGGMALALLAAWVPAALASWRLMFLIMIVPNVFLVAALLLCRDGRPGAGGRGGGLVQVLAWFRRHPVGMGLYFCGAGGSVLVVQTVGAWASSELNREHGLTPAHAALAFGVALLFASPLGHLAAGALVDWRKRYWTPANITAAGLLSTVPLLLALPHLRSALAACLALALVSLAGGTAAVAALAGLPAMFPPPLRAVAVRLFLVFITLAGTAFGPFLAGVVSDRLATGAPSAGSLSAALRLVCVSVAVLGVVAALLAHRGWRRATAEASA